MWEKAITLKSCSSKANLRACDDDGITHLQHPETGFGFGSGASSSSADFLFRTELRFRVLSSKGMPDRIIREGIITSQRISNLSWGAEVFYRRLLNKVDDFARYDGRLSILRAHLYPLQLEKVRESDIETWIAESREAGLVRLYVVEGKQYVLVENFRQRIRAKDSKWPQPPADDSHPPPIVSTCQSSARLDEGECGVGCVVECEGDARAPDDSLAELPQVAAVVVFGNGPPGIPEDYCRYYHAKKTETHGWVKNGRLIVWRGELVRWWQGDRENWMARKRQRNGEIPESGTTSL